MVHEIYKNDKGSGKMRILTVLYQKIWLRLLSKDIRVPTPGKCWFFLPKYFFFWCWKGRFAGFSDSCDGTIKFDEFFNVRIQFFSKYVLRYILNPIRTRFSIYREMEHLLFHFWWNRSYGLKLEKAFQKNEIYQSRTYQRFFLKLHTKNRDIFDSSLHRLLAQCVSSCYRVWKPKK